jgi:hypothetical protein
VHINNSLVAISPLFVTFGHTAVSLKEAKARASLEAARSADHHQWAMEAAELRERSSLTVQQMAEV